MQHLVHRLRDQHDLILHQRVNEFFYMQKIEELTLLVDRFNALRTDLDEFAHQLRAHYRQCFTHWSRDARWVNVYVHRVKGRSIL